MARTDTLGNFLTDVAEAIRTKEGTTATITASEFDTRIANLPGETVTEDLSEELTTQDTSLTNQNITLHDIIYALAGKGLPVDGSAVEPDYITDGLVAWWEGCDDLDGNNHWVSRIGTGYIYPKTLKVGTASTNVFDTIKSKNGYKNNMTYGLVTSEDYYIQGYTIEVVGSVNTTATSDVSTTSNSGATLVAFDKTASPMIQIFGSTGDFGCLNSVSPTYGMPTVFTNCVNKKHKYAISLDEIQSRTTSSGYFTISYAINDTEWYTRNRESVTNMSNTTPDLTILCYYNKSYLSSGEINSIRIYNRKLTNEELKHNYEIDNARFKLDAYEIK